MTDLSQALRGMNPVAYILVTAGMGFIWAMIGWSIMMTWMWLSEKVERYKRDQKIQETIQMILREVPKEGGKMPGEIFLAHIERHSKAGGLPPKEVACPYCHLFLNEVLTLSQGQEDTIIRELHEWRKKA